jgi:hypothetical protein
LELKDEGNKWIKMMREVSDEQESIPTDSDILANDDEPAWDESDYEIREPPAFPEFEK